MDRAIIDVVVEEQVAEQVESTVVTLSQFDLALIGGGVGEVIFG